jgi:hypothetical protein
LIDNLIEIIDKLGKSFMNLLKGDSLSTALKAEWSWYKSLTKSRTIEPLEGDKSIPATVRHRPFDFLYSRLTLSGAVGGSSNRLNFKLRYDKATTEEQKQIQMVSTRGVEF